MGRDRILTRDERPAMAEEGEEGGETKAGQGERRKGAAPEKKRGEAAELMRRYSLLTLCRYGCASCSAEGRRTAAGSIFSFGRVAEWVETVQKEITRHEAKNKPPNKFASAAAVVCVQRHG